MLRRLRNWLLRCVQAASPTTDGGCPEQITEMKSELEMSVEWPLPETATCEEIHVAIESISETLPSLQEQAATANVALAEVASSYEVRKSAANRHQNNLDRALYKLEVLQARLNTDGC